MGEGPVASERVVREHPLTEPVDGADGRALEAEIRRFQPRAGRPVDAPVAFRGFDVFNRVHDAAQGGADARTHLAGGLLGERHHEDLVEARAADQMLHHEVLEGVGLPRPGRRLDDRVSTDRDSIEDGRARIPHERPSLLERPSPARSKKSS